MLSVPVSITVGAYVNVNTQLFPEPVTVQEKSLVPLQSGGSVVFESASPDIGRPSAEVNATVIVWLAPATTETVPATDGVAFTESGGGVEPPPTLSPIAGPLLPPPSTVAPEAEAIRFSDPLLVLDAPSKLQPANSDSVQTPPRRIHCIDGIFLDSPDSEDFHFDRVKGYKVISERTLADFVNCVTKPRTSRAAVTPDRGQYSPLQLNPVAKQRRVPDRSVIEDQAFDT